MESANTMKKTLETKLESTMSDKQTYELNFGGLPFKLRSSHDEETVKELAQYVELKLQQAIQATKSGSYQSAAILAALNIAEEFILLKRRALSELSRIEERTLKISKELENSKVHSSEVNQDSNAAKSAKVESAITRKEANA